MSDFNCRVCGLDLRAEVTEALTAGVADFGFQRDLQGQDPDDYRIVEVECRKGHQNSFRLRGASGGD